MGCWTWEKAVVGGGGGVLSSGCIVLFAAVKLVDSLSQKTYEQSPGRIGLSPQHVLKRYTTNRVAPRTKWPHIRVPSNERLFSLPAWIGQKT